MMRFFILRFLFTKPDMCSKISVTSTFPKYGESMEYQIIRSNRKSFSIQIRGTDLIVRAPLRATDEQVQAVVLQHKGWIEAHMAEARQKSMDAASIEKLSTEELHALADQAMQVIPQRVEYYAQKIGVTYGRIMIRNQRTRWGSCSSKGNLNFNCLLMLAPPEVLDSVVVHELCHRKEMNHSDRFYAEVLRLFPDYRKWNQWLKDHGSELMARMA